jgi:hypothetical protein
MYKLIDVIEFLLRSSFRNPIEFYYNSIGILYIMCNAWCVMCEDWVLYYELFNFSSKNIIVQTLCIYTWLVPYAMVSTCTWIYRM